MAKYDKKTASLRLSDKQTDPEAKIEIRPLAEDELQRLERALGKSVDRQYLAYWVSEAIRDVVKLSMLPTAHQLRTDLTRMARDGRQWLRHVDEYYDTFSPRQRAELDQLRTAADAFLESVDFMAAQAAASIKAGRPRTHFGLLAFLDRMVGIAKRTKVLPSTPMRAIPTKKSPPAFFQFVDEALAISRDVIGSLPLSPGQEFAALSILDTGSNEALIKILEELRGRVSVTRSRLTDLSSDRSAKQLRDLVVDLPGNRPLHFQNCG